MSILDKIDNPQDIKELSFTQLRELAKDIREYILESIQVTGGHLGSSLGTVELSLALHYVFDTPKDKFVWDVGHQAYTHKILTGRREKFKTNRTYKGISGFVKPSESEHDAFGVGHASTSISAGLGFVVARDIKGEDNHVISIIGDGSITGGLAFEGLNNAGALQKKFLVILNDNEMSISKNVGAISRYLSSIYTDSTFNKIKDEAWDFTKKIKFGDTIRKAVSKGTKSVKALITSGQLFENFGFNYIGPVDGHNVESLSNILKNIRDNVKGPVFLHVITKKGKGFKPAEEDIIQKLHGVGPGAIYPKKIEPTGKQTPKYQDIFGDSLCRLAKDNSKLIGITAAMKDGTGLNKFADKFPERFYDVGIAEGHAVTFAAALSLAGFKPVVAIYSTFIQRAIDNIIHDCAIQDLDMIFALDRAGLVGEDGPTHHGVFDLTFLRMVPNITIMAPSDEDQLSDMLYTASKNRGLFAIRYPRGKGRGVDLKAKPQEIEIGTGIELIKGEKVAVLAVGKMVDNCYKAIKDNNLGISLYDMRFIKPLDEKLLHSVFNEYDQIITVEENCLAGGFGSSVLEFSSDNLYKNRVTRIGIPDRFITHGNVDLLFKEVGIDQDGLYRKFNEVIQKLKEGN
ncbi:MAG: 1-deoxy-D-xylulose-5-phosphate synthase [Candidatus Cloacimonadota bacterium]|nr:MAG: 1-deoxy-D-xylulose-5-phosphate synthase [Candidatus Cloacimonadota bacterium]PIE81119.1 MAG: 1-deoxy-D-xylulose-5-phosphate synthase [Candidatus Delongbacteria bacterium]